MQWILLGIIAVALVILARYQPKLGFGMLGGLAIITAAILLFTDNSGVINRSKINVNEIVVENSVMTPTYGNSYKVNARLANNNSTSTLRELTLSFTMLDCDDTQNDCTVIGQKEKTINIKIPPTQSRDIEQLVSFDFAKPTKDLRWNIIVTKTRN